MNNIDSAIKTLERELATLKSMQRIATTWDDEISEHQTAIKVLKGDLSQTLKGIVLRTYKKCGNESMLKYGNKHFTGFEVAKEIESESEFGVKIINGLLQLTIDLVKRDKINTNKQL